MNKLNRKLPQVDPSHFAMVPRNDVPRSTFATTHTVKTTLDTDYLVPIHVDEVLPGDVHDGNVTIFARLNNLIFPLMDNLTAETFFFFVPCRLIWSNWQKFMGEQANPGDSTSYLIPQVASPPGGFIVGGLGDNFGLPTAGQLQAGLSINVNSLPFRAYNLIFNQWFRDENLMNSLNVPMGDGPDSLADFNLEKRCKKHDYFTSCLPWPLKGGVNVNLPLNGQANILTNISDLVTGAHNPLRMLHTDGTTTNVGVPLVTGSGGSTRQQVGEGTAGTGATTFLYPSNLYADLSTATGASINATRLAVATQQFLEKDARGGTRYTELLRNHFGVTPEDARLQRPEYIGGGRSTVQTQAIPQTSATKITGSDTAIGSLTGQALVADQHRFKYHATEHGYIIGLLNVSGDVTYQQGLHRMWSRQTRYDIAWPTFVNLGEQAVLRKEIYCRGDGVAGDDQTFGYQERYAEYRYRPSRISGLFRSTAALNIDEWHLSEQFLTAPGLNATFIRQNTPSTRVLAAGNNAIGQEILYDSVFNIRCTRALPTYSVPGLLRF
ncbi:MAG: major capsid protein [Microvirus sp.]|nr:MAG: major capsid protein [Microvirus sp.]